MPPKVKKQQKTTSKQTISISEAELYFPLDPDRFLRSLDEASATFPSLIGKSAFVGRLVEVQSESRGCKLWLSEASMAAYSISPASLVSVSLAPFGDESSNRCPLRPFVGEYGPEVGNYFALAAVFPSSKVLNEGLRLSSNLSHTMAFPPSGSIMFVYPVLSRHMGGSAIQNELHLLEKVNGFFLHSSRELYLDLVSLKNKEKGNSELLSKHDFSCGRTPNKVEDEATSAISTLSSMRKLSSSGSGQLASPSYEVSVSNLEEPGGLCYYSFDINEILRDESSKKVLEACAMSWLYSRCLLPGNIVSIPLLSELCFFRVRGGGVISQDLKDSVEPLDHLSAAFAVDHDTKIHLALSLNKQSESVEERSTLALQHYKEDLKIRVGAGMLKLGGLSKECAVLKDIIISSVMNNALSSFGLRTTKGVLLHGPPGTGKTSLARLCANDVGVRLFSINGPEVVREYYGESEQALHEVFESASQATPSVVFIDELDAIAPARTDGGEELSQRMVATLLNLMDGVGRVDGVLVLAATNRIDCIDPALRRPGRLDRELEIGVPSSMQRLDILHTLLDGMDHALSDHEVQELAITTHGFVGADLASLCNEAALVCLRHCVMSLKNPFSSVCCFPNDHHSEENVGVDGGRNLRSQYSSDSEFSFTNSFTTCESPASAVQSKSQEMSLANENWILKITFEDFEKARMKVRPSAMREVLLEIPKVSWKDVGGQDEAKAQLMEVVQWPQKHQDAFKRIGTRPPTGVLMFGPPGCSKTLLARAVASEAGLNFLAVKGPELFSKWVGESEKAVRSLFAKARANAPSIIFFDEIDSLAIARGKENDAISVSDRVMSQLLVELDGLHQRVDVTVIAATNRPDKIDSALLRPGRFDRLLYVGPPNDRDREEIFRIHLHKFPCSADVNVKELARLTEGSTGADIALICREAALAALEESLDAEQIRMEHFKLGLRQIRQSNVQLYQELSAKFQRLVQSSSGVDHGYQQRDGGSDGSRWVTLMEFIGRFFHPWTASSVRFKTSEL